MPTDYYHRPNYAFLYYRRTILFEAVSIGSLQSNKPACGLQQFKLNHRSNIERLNDTHLLND